MVWKIQRSLPVFTSNARMWPGVPGSVSGTLAGMISRSSKTTPGVLALTLSPSTGRPSPSRRSMRPFVPKEGIGWPRLPVERVQEVAIGDEDAILCTVTPRCRNRVRAGRRARIEPPDLLAGRRIRPRPPSSSASSRRARRRRRWGCSHLRVLERVAAVVGPRDLQGLHIGLVDLRQRREADVVLAAIDRPVDVGSALFRRSRGGKDCNEAAGERELRRREWLSRGGL